LLRRILVGCVVVAAHFTFLRNLNYADETPPTARPSPDQIIDGEAWSEIRIDALFGPPFQTRGKGLVVVPGHGADPQRAEIIRNNTRYIPFDRFDCVVFVYADVRGRAARDLDLGGCRAVHKTGQWVDFQWMIAPAAVAAAGYTTVTVLLDDVLIAPPEYLREGRADAVLDLERMRDLLEAHGLDALSPSVYASDKAEMSAGLGPLDADHAPPRLSAVPHPGGFRRVGYNEVQLVMFRATSASGWPCFRALLDPTRHPAGWGHDLCYRKFCNASLGRVDAVVIHCGRPSAYADLPGTVPVNYDAATAGMHDWAARYKRNHPSLSDWPDDGRQIVRRCASR